MKIFIVTYHYPPEISGGVDRTLLMEKYLIGKGHDVRILTCQNRSQGEYGARILSHVPFGKELGLCSKKSKQVWRNNILSQALLAMRRAVLFPDPMRSWAQKAIKLATQSCIDNRPDFLFTTSPPESVHLVGLAIASKYDIPWIADLRDGWCFEPHRPEASLPIRRFFENKLESEVIHHAYKMTTATRPILKDLVTRYPGQANKFYYFPIGFEPFRNKSYNKGCSRFCTIVYAGRFGLSRLSQTPQFFFQALEHLLENHPEIRTTLRLKLYGEYTGLESKIWQTLQSSKNVEVYPPVSKKEILQQCKASDILLLMTPPNQSSISTRKLFDYLSVKRPIFALAHGNEAARIIKETSSGLCVAPDNLNTIKQGLLEIWKIWKDGKLSNRFPCTNNDDYLAEHHLDNFFGSLLQ